MIKKIFIGVFLTGSLFVLGLSFMELGTIMSDVLIKEYYIADKFDKMPPNFNMGYNHEGKPKDFEIREYSDLKRGNNK